MKNKKIDFLLVFFIVLVGLILRLYKINLPLADYHSWRQADTAAVARNFIKEKKIDLFHPRYDDLSSIQSGKENPHGYRMVELPIYQAIITWLYFINPKVSLEVYGRLTSIFFTLITITVVYFLMSKETNRLAAFFSSFTLAVLPFFVFFTRTFLPESTATGFVFLAIFFLYLFSKTTSYYQWLMYFFSLIFFSFSLLIKPTTIFYFFPLFYLFYLKYKKKLFITPFFYLYFICAFIPLIFWRVYINQYEEGIPANQWLLTSINTADGLKKIFFRPSFFRWIFFERLNNLIFGGYLAFFFLLGIVFRRKGFFWLSFLLTMFSYFFTFQGGNVQHEYYQILIFPILAIFVGLGVDGLFSLKAKVISRLFLGVLVFLIYGFSFYFSYDKVKNYYHIPQDLIYTASIIHSLTKEDDLIVTDTMGDTTLLYLSNRRGYPAVYKDLSYFKNLGAKYFYTRNRFVIEDILKSNIYPVVFRNNQFALFRL